MIKPAVETAQLLLKIFIILSTVLFGYLLSEAAEQEEIFDALIMKSIESCIDHNYAEAESAAVELIRFFPESPAGYFYRAGVISSIMLDYEECVREKDFFRYIKQAEAMAKSSSEADPDDPWNHFYLGGARGYIAFHHIRNDNLFPAFIKGLKAIKEMKRTIELDTTLYDAYLGLGNYLYWISSRTEFLKWTPFISDRREEGIELMYLAMEKGKYSRETAASSLAWVLIHAKRFEEALEVVKEPLERHPDSRFFLFANARTLFEIGRYEESIKLYEKLLNSVRQAPLNNHFNEIGILVKLAMNYAKLRQFEIAYDYCQEGLNIPISKDMRERKAESLKSLKKMSKGYAKHLPKNR